MIIPLSTNGKPPCVLLHGWGVNSCVWQPVLAGLAQYFTVHCIDLPGFDGNTQVLVEGYELDRLAQLVAAKVPDASVVLGWSMGGLVATRIATLYREKVAALGLVASSPCFIAQTDWPGVRPQLLAGFESLIGQDVAKTLQRFLAIQSIGAVSAKQDIQWPRHQLTQQPLPTLQALTGGLKLLADSDLRAELLQLANQGLTVAAVTGEHDQLVPSQALSKLSGQAALLQHDWIAGAAHPLFISHSAEFIDWAVAKFTAIA